MNVSLRWTTLPWVHGRTTSSTSSALNVETRFLPRETGPRAARVNSTFPGTEYLRMTTLVSQCTRVTPIARHVMSDCGCRNARDAKRALGTGQRPLRHLVGSGVGNVLLVR